MLATYLNSLREAFNRRVALVLIGIALLISVLLNSFVRIQSFPDGTDVVLMGSRSLGPAETAVPDIVEKASSLLGTLLPLLAIFAAAPMLASTLEKGWLELTFSKGTPRWKIFFGRFLGGATLYSCTFLLATFPLAYRLWWQTYVSTWQVIVALLLETLGFVALLAVAALATLPQKGVALPIMASVAIWFFSSPLAHRYTTYYQFLNSYTARWLVDWIYRIFPKCSELDSLSSSFIQHGHITSWWPIWSTGIFTVAVLGLALGMLDRKSF